jgi:DNA-binding transcriptional LysR family regulator
MNWDDLRILEAVRDEGTFARASARLRIDETTVGRRIARLQQAMGFKLFDLVDGERRPTAEGEAAINHVRAMAGHAAEIGSIRKNGIGPVGHFRIAATNSVAEALLAPRLGALLSANHGISVQFMTSGDNVNLSGWRADLAVRLRKPERGDFSITKLADLRLYLFEPADASRQAEIVCCYPDGLEFTPESRFLKSRGLLAKARCVTDNVRVIRSLLESGTAAGVLPEYLCADLIANPRLKATALPSRREAWLLIQNHLKRDHAARVVIGWLRECFGGRRSPH